MQVAQTVHAAGESAGPGGVSKGAFAVALAVPDEATLRALSVRLTEADIPHSLIEESDGAFGGQAMAIGVRPTREREGVRRLVSSLQLVK